MIIGIDPGFSGAIAVLHEDGYVVFAEDMPAIKTGKKTELNLSEILRLFKKYTPSHVFIEKAQAMPNQGCVSMFRYGKGAGLIEGIVIGLEIPRTLVIPQAWKKSMMEGMPKDKGMSIIRVNQLFPNFPIGSRKKDHGKADAILIAEYGRRFL